MEGGQGRLFEVLETVEANIRPVLARSEKAKCMVYITQRHYRTQRSAAEIDARLEADLRTLMPGKRRGAKYQPEWIFSIYQILANKRSNIQLGIEAHFPYDSPAARSSEIAELFAASWVAMAPIVELGQAPSSPGAPCQTGVE